MPPCEGNQVNARTGGGGDQEVGHGRPPHGHAQEAIQVDGKQPISSPEDAKPKDQNLSDHRPKERPQQGSEYGHGAEGDEGLDKLSIRAVRAD